MHRNQLEPLSRSPRRRPMMIATVLLLFSGSWLVAQFMAHMQMATPPARMGSIRYGGGYQTRMLPSELRFAASSSGLLPSQHRNLNFLSGALPSQGSYTYLARPTTRYSPNWASTYALGGSTRYTAPPAYMTGLSYGLGPPARPYQPGLMRPNPLIGGSSLIRPIGGYSIGSIRYR